MFKIKIGKKYIGENFPTYFIADIAANHDGSLKRAKKLIKLSAKAGANAAKFQHFKAETIVSDYAFRQLKKIAHQKDWKESVFDTYKKASINPDWNKELKKTCDKYKIDFMTAPYDLKYVDEVFNFVKAYKIGSGDITWLEIIKKISKKKKPVILATGASSMKDVKRAINCIKKYNNHIVLMQCNTNYTGAVDNLKYLNLNTLKKYRDVFGSKIILGLSDHTHGYLSVLTAVAMGARVIEKHFTDNNSRPGPDHKFSMNPKSWTKMVEKTRCIEKTFGDGIKKIERNELESSIVQRRSIKSKYDLKAGTILKKNMIINLRPKTEKGFFPYEENKIIGNKLKKSILRNEEITWKHLK
jgi:N-acetylneuraminate synthase